MTRCFVKAVGLVDFEMGIMVTFVEQSKIEDVLNRVLIGEVNWFVRATEPCLKRADSKLSTVRIVVILVLCRMSSTSSLDKPVTIISSSFPKMSMI